jgi:ecotropic viral integration site 5 protein
VAGNAKEEQMLLNVLLAVAHVKPAIGYCQGMNFLGAVMLKVCENEEIAFWLLVGMMQKWDMENMYVPGVPDLGLREFQMNHYVNSLMPDLYAHFRNIGVTNAFFISRWFMTLFSTFLPLPAILKVWDCFMLEGWKVILKVGIALLKLIRPIIINFDLEEISTYLRKNMQEISYEKISSICQEIKITKKELRKLEELYYMEQVNFKLLAVEISHAHSEDDLSAMRWAKGNIDDFDDQTKSDIEKFQRKITKLDAELESFTKHYLVVTMEYYRVHSEMESLTEKQQLYCEMLKTLQKKFKKSKVTRFLKKIIQKKKAQNKGSNAVEKLISQEDIETCKLKLEKIEKELEVLNIQYNEKTTIYKEALIKGKELNEKKKSYSAQLCDFLVLIK